MTTADAIIVMGNKFFKDPLRDYRHGNAKQYRLPGL